LIKEFSWIVLGQIFSILGALVGIRVLTGLLIPAEYGKLALGMSVTTFIAVSTIGPLTGGVVRYFAPARQEGKLGSYFKAVKELTSRLSLGIIIISLVGLISILISGKSEYFVFVLGAIAFALLENYQNMINAIQNAARQRSIVAFHNVISTWFKFIIASGFIILIWNSSVIAIWGYAISMLLVIFSQLYYLNKLVLRKNDLKIINKKEVADYKSKIFSQSWPVAIWGILSSIYVILDKWSLELFSTTTIVGVYSALFQLGSFPIRLFVNLFTSLIVPIYYEKAGNASENKKLLNVYHIIESSTYIAAILFLVLIIFIYLFQENLIFYFLGNRNTYLANSYILPWITLSAVMTNLSSIICFAFRISNNIKIMLKPFAITTLIGIISVIIGANIAGLKGVVVAINIESLIKLLWTIKVFKKDYANLIYKDYQLNKQAYT
tara:strand:+ start:6333 stop:7646 length:1314 start_codon:yes stop_codon:yes gene_type:complete